jgi:hypothetical protein
MKKKIISSINCSVCSKEIINPNPRQKTCGGKCAKMHVFRYKLAYRNRPEIKAHKSIMNKRYKNTHKK